MLFRSDKLKEELDFNKLRQKMDEYAMEAVEKASAEREEKAQAGVRAREVKARALRAADGAAAPNEGAGQAAGECTNGGTLTLCLQRRGRSASPTEKSLLAKRGNAFRRFSLERILEMSPYGSG